MPSTSRENLESKDGINSILKEALRSNHTLQTELRKSLRKVYQKKAANRQEYLWGLQSLVRLENSFTSSNQSVSLHRRPWHRRYFIDCSDSSVPEPNSDTIRRLKWEGEKDLSAVTRPWSKAELSSLQHYVDIVSRQQRNIDPINNSDVIVQSTSEQDIDFELVGQLMSQAISTENAESTPSDVINDRSCLRTSTDCRNKYLTTLSPLLNTSSFTKAESMKILELVTKEGGHPKWDEVAQTLGTKRSPFACFRHYQLKLNNNTSTSAIKPFEPSAILALCAPTTWSYLEDELLLKYIAASGPQTFLNQRFAADVGIRFFPHMTVKQIVLRMSSTLLIPTLKHERWSDKEERKLALCMRVYCNTASPENEAQVHFPNRAAKAVFIKWARCMNPEFSTQPYTSQEDKALLKAVTKAGGAVNWKAISSKFPHRNPRSLFYHWTCIAPKEDILKRHEESYIVKTAAKRGAVGYGEDEDQLPLEEFVVCARKKSKNSF